MSTSTTWANKLGIERIAHYSRLLGLGSTDRDRRSAGEKSPALVPDPEWSLEKERVLPWYPGRDHFGSNRVRAPVLVTPLQMATMMATVANPGATASSHFICSASRQSVPREPNDRWLWTRTRSRLFARGCGKWSMSRAPEHGLCIANGRDLDIYGKTGTAQVIRHRRPGSRAKILPTEQRDHAWFVSYARESAIRKPGGTCDPCRTRRSTARACSRAACQAECMRSTSGTLLEQ